MSERQGFLSASLGPATKITGIERAYYKLKKWLILNLDCLILNLPANVNDLDFVLQVRKSHK